MVMRVRRMDSRPVVKYFKDNIRKGYTVEQIADNLARNGYDQGLIDAAKNSLSKKDLELSKRNPTIFDHSKISYTPMQSNNGMTKGSQNTGAQGQQSQGVEKHPGLDKNTMIRYGGILGGVFIVIILGLFFLGTSDDTSDLGSGEFESGDGSALDDGDAADAEQDPFEDDEDPFGEDTEDDDGIDDTSQDDNETESDDVNINGASLNETSANETEDYSEDMDISDDMNQTFNESELDEMDQVGNGSQSNTTVGDYCEEDSDCIDQDIITINYCEENVCRRKLDDGRECVSGDGFCPPRCYGYDNDVDECFNEDGIMRCEEDSHCDNDDRYTDDVCGEDGLCIHVDIDPGPEIIDYERIAFDDVEYSEEIEVDDSGFDNISFSLDNPLENMSINETSGLLTWIPDIEDYDASSTELVVRGDRRRTEEPLDIDIHKHESSDDDPIYGDCDEDLDCFLDEIIEESKYYQCKDISRYWDEPDSEVDECLNDMAYSMNDPDVCDLIGDEEMVDECHDSL